MHLEFPPSSGGVAYGLADAGIETFEGNYSHFVVRECIQNSLDAAANDTTPVKVSFRHLSFTPKSLPFFDELKRALASCEKKWQGREREDRFFKEARKQLESSHIDVLEISDSGTKGAPGKDDDHNKPWHGLVKSRGNSVHKDEGSAGSFGIGKDAPLAASAFRTVLYSSQTQPGHLAFQGVCRLATHIGPDKRETQQTGFIGAKTPHANGLDSAYVALRSRECIPPTFQRNEAGLSIWVIGFRYGADKWQERFTASAIANFWPAILSGKLQVKIQDNELNSENLAEAVERYKSHDGVKEQLPFFKAHQDPVKTFIDQVNIAGHSTLRILTGADLPRQICLTRKSGMIIGKYRPQGLILPFAGIYQCNDTYGNKLLRTLEPPTHDKWDPARAKTPDEKKIYPAIKDWIRNQLKELNPAHLTDVFDETNVSKFIAPDDSAELPDTSDKTSGESLEPNNKSTIDDTNQTNVKPVISMTQPSGGGEAEGESGGGEGSESDNPGEGDGENTGGRPGTSGESGSGDDPAISKTRIKSMRAYTTDGGDSYQIVLRGEAEKAVDLFIFAHGDDGQSNSLSIKQAKDSDSGDVYTASGDLIRNISLGEEGQATRLTITLTHPGKYSIGARIK